MTKWGEASSLSQVLVGARVRYDEIHDWISIVDSEQQVSQSIRWDVFEKYIDGLDVLERALFDLAVALNKENELLIQLRLQINGDFTEFVQRQRFQSYHPPALYPHERMGDPDQEPSVKRKRDVHLQQTPTGIPLDVARIRIGTAFSQAMYIFSILRLLNKKTTLTAEMWVYFEEAKNLCAGVGLDKPRGDGWSRLMVVIRKVVELPP
ncbi:hypothetical protein Moror_14646 [Moniliophthora roreri MCA 2997]|uniref:Uncharacterized protein n=1 Tax=Moniliophthora roreri (strain MCA 2997) TaxID=1381753 RepID=V2XK36_MONRO|nr:hypothetical protein Moror_14646 [Moniliophthora roreri MCA 2997]